MEELAASIEALPNEIIRAIFIAGVEDHVEGKKFGARCSRLASWVRLWVTPVLYRSVDLWTNAQASSFLSTIEQDAPSLPYQYRTLVHSLCIKSNAFSAYDTQHTHSESTQMEPGNFTPMVGMARFPVSRLALKATHQGVTGDVAIKILSVLNQTECIEWRELEIPMVILATRRTNAVPTIHVPRSVTLTGVDGLIWNAYNWNALTRIRLTSYNPTFQETRWLMRLPQLTHCAFAFYHEAPLGIRIVEEMTSMPRVECVLVVVYPSSRGPGKVDKASIRRELLKLDEPKLVVWQDTPQMENIFQDEDVDRFWKRIEDIIEKQKSERQAALNAVP